MTDTKALREKIDESGYKSRFIAERVGITYQGLLKKINNETEFKASEIQKLCELLRIDVRGKEKIFFASEVGKKSTN